MSRGYHCKLCGDRLSITAPLLQIHEANGTRGYPICRDCLRRIDELIKRIQQDHGEE